MSELGSLATLKRESRLKLLKILTRLFVAVMAVVLLSRSAVALPLPWPLVGTQIFYSLVLLLLPRWAERSQSLRGPSIVLLAGLFGTIGVAAWGAGGLTAPVLVALPFLPLLSALLLGRRSLPGVSAVVLLLLLGLYGAQICGFVTEQPFDPQMRSLLQLIMVILVTSICVGLGYYSDYQNDQMHRQLMLWANTDGLTGVANRRLFDESFQQEWLRNQRMGRPLSLLLVDIDHFKRYNDAHGHVEGDRCLVAVAQAISNHCRRSGELVARYGGEEFAVILPNVDLPEAANIADNLLTDIGAMHERGSPDLKQAVTVSIGFACTVPRQADQPQRFIIQVDEALYRAKRAGRNQSVGSSGPGLWLNS